jgi:hypothetical protein
VQHPENLIDEWLGLSSLLHDEMATALLGNLDERVTSHVLNTCTAIRHVNLVSPPGRLAHKKAAEDTQGEKRFQERTQTHLHGFHA